MAVVVLEGDEFTGPTRERYARPDQGSAYYRDSFDYKEVFDRVSPTVRTSFRAAGAAREFDLSVWLDMPLEQIVPRALRRRRDLERMGGPDGVRRRYAERYVPGQRLHLTRDRPQQDADLVFSAD